ncbi:MAG: hypothetical protein QXL17_02960, partial [Candidatus Thermoplasmatota archaeon]
MLTKDELYQIGTEMFGEKKWRTELAGVIGLSPARMYQLAAADIVPNGHSEKIRQVYAEWKVNNRTPFIGMQETIVSVLPEEAALTDEQISLRIEKRFSIMNRMVGGMLAGTIRSLIVYGAPGIGKTFDI